MDNSNPYRIHTCHPVIINLEILKLIEVKKTLLDNSSVLRHIIRTTLVTTIQDQKKLLRDKKDRKKKKEKGKDWNTKAY